ncbi:DUF2505 domain-containing protein [Isoptericola sp. NEAU-Y5]|uniref:DUF2505 domain-containing protein n=1 Tax=Isoptericola luteus TaxID=2879484 RepID=A0ABS7ZCL6_9MICO|nr:DUF2505 domain-containing protein [Isoptericola sp. NEAU-Y5]MCA5892796.1 DUF2505 domain-containing protein [Isoptericola sp. NEAU-Y5]
MHLTVELTYPADADAVAAMLADESFVRWRAERAGPGRVEQVDVAGDPAGGFTVSVRRTLPTDLIPAQARPLVGDHLEVRQAEAWEGAASGPRVGTVAVEIAGTPVRVTGRVVLEQLPDGDTRQVYEVEVRASIPLFGATVADAAARAVRTTLEAEGAAGREWLERHLGPTDER